MPRNERGQCALPPGTGGWMDAVPWAEPARRHAADAAPNNTGAIPCLITSIVLKHGGGCVSERYRQMLEAVSEVTGMHAALRPGIYVQHSSCTALASAVS